jgi:hypothetical protein
MDSTVFDDGVKEPMMFFLNGPLTRLVSKSLYGTAMIAILLFPSIYIFIERSSGSSPKYTVDLASFQSLNNGTQSRAVSLAFNLTVHVDNSASFKACCHNHGEVVVSYSGVALAWGRLPGRFCVQRRSAISFTVVTWGNGVFLPDDLRRRFLPDWSVGTAKELVDMKLHRYPNYSLLPLAASPSTSSISQELMLGKTSELQISLL